jgi:uncharacterized protein (DUF362 family)
MSKVVVIRFSSPILAKGQEKEQYKLMLQLGLRSLSGEDDIKKSLRKYIPAGVVGMKTNCLARKFNSTPIYLCDALGAILIEMGTEENDIIIWERTGRELEMAGYKLNASSFGKRCFGTDTNGVGYSGDFYNSGDVNSLVTRILTEVVDSNINLPVLKDHSIAGLSAALKNLYGAINNPNKWHGNNCDPFAAHIANFDPIKNKNKLTIIDAMRVQYNGGPGYDSRYVADYKGLIISDDPVAADRIGLEIVEHYRKLNNLPTLEKAVRPAKYLKSAEKLGLGVEDITKIELTVSAIDLNGIAKSTKLFDE